MESNIPEITNTKQTTEKIELLASTKQKEVTGGNVNYYLINITNPKRLQPYVVEVEDIIEALNMEFAEGTILKSLIRYCKLKQGLGKPGSSKKYEVEKMQYYAARLVAKSNLLNTE